MLCYYHPFFSCFIKIQIGLTFLVPAYPGCPGKEAIKWVSVLYSVVLVTYIFASEPLSMNDVPSFKIQFENLY